MEMIEACVQNAGKETYLCSIKFESFRPEERAGKPTETWRTRIEREMTEVGEIWN